MNFNFNKLAVAVFVACNTGLIAVAAEGTTNLNDNAAVSRALGHLHSKSALKSARVEAYVPRDVVIDQDGAEHVRFDRTMHGLRVIGGDLITHASADGALTEITNHQLAAAKSASVITGDLSHALGADIAARDQAKSLFQGVQAGDATSEKVFYARDREPTLAFDVMVKGTGIDGTPSEMHYIVDAATNTLLDSYDGVKTLMPREKAAGLATARRYFATPFASRSGADVNDLFEPESVLTKSASSAVAKAASSGTGRTLLSGTVTLTTDSITGGFAMRDPSRGNHYVTNMNSASTGNGTLFTDTDNIWGNFATSNAATAAADAAYGQSITWDFYKNVLGRNGIANDGRGAFSRVHFRSNYSNASWSDSCFCMSYGDGNGSSVLPLVAIDVAGHEMTHGVTSRSAGLIYSGESGGLNEAISDIMGTAVEFYSNNATSPPNYLIGERIYSANKGVAAPTQALRYMFKPSIDGQSPDCYTSTIGQLNVHYSSGVANHFFYLLSEGAKTHAGFSTTPAQMVCNGNTALTAIGRTAAVKIIYRALTVYMTSSSNYKAARTATLRAATDLYGTGSTQYNAVAAAWSAVSVN